MKWSVTRRQRMLLWFTVGGMLLAAGLRIRNDSGSPIFPLLCAVIFALLALGPRREDGAQ